MPLRYNLLGAATLNVCIDYKSLEVDFTEITPSSDYKLQCTWQVNREKYTLVL